MPYRLRHLLPVDPDDERFEAPLKPVQRLEAIDFWVGRLTPEP